MSTQYILVGYIIADGKKIANGTFIEDDYRDCHERIAQMLCEYGYDRVLVQYSMGGEFNQKTYRLNSASEIVEIENSNSVMPNEDTFASSSKTKKFFRLEVRNLDRYQSIYAEILSPATTEKEAMQDARNVLAVSKRLNYVDKIILVIDASTDEVLYQGNFDNNDTAMWNPERVGKFVY